MPASKPLLLALGLALVLLPPLRAERPIIDLSSGMDLLPHLGKKVIVTGTVERIVTLSQNDQRMFFQGNPNFYGFIYRDRREALGQLDLNAFLGHTIFLAGEIGEFRGKPQIIIDDLRQLGPTADSVALPVGKPWPPPLPPPSP
ncbi:MAG: hypothetical protein SNJ84_03370 [Verrucomicrobiia bacterium]